MVLARPKTGLRLKSETLGLHRIIKHASGNYNKGKSKEVCLMEAGVRNKLVGVIEEIKTDDLMALVKISVEG